MPHVLKAEQVRAGPRRVRPLWEPAVGAAAPSPPAPSPASAPGPSSAVLTDEGTSAELHRLRALVLEMAAQIAEARERLIREAETQAVELAVAMAERIVRRELRTQPETVRTMVAAAIAETDQGASVRVRVHPDDVDLIRGDEAAGSGGVGALPELVPDASLSPGDCVVEAEVGLVDARLATQLAQLREAALKAI